MNNMKSFFSLTVLCLLAFSSCKSKKDIPNEEPEIVYEDNYAFDFIKMESLMDVVDLAERENKLVFLDVYTDWCLPCQIMDEEVFTNESLGEFFNEHFISYKVDAEKPGGEMVLQLYNVKGYPSLIFLDTKGKVLEQKNGIAYARELRSLAESSINIDQNNKSTD